MKFAVLSIVLAGIAAVRGDAATDAVIKLMEGGMTSEQAQAKYLTAATTAGTACGTELCLSESMACLAVAACATKLNAGDIAGLPGTGDAGVAAATCLGSEAFTSCLERKVQAAMVEADLDVTAISAALGIATGESEALELATSVAACYSACDIDNNDDDHHSDDTNDSIVGASCTSGDGSSELKACCAKCGDPTSSAVSAAAVATSNGTSSAGTPCTDACGNTKEGTPLFCVTDEYLATESDGSKFCSCQNRNFRITKGEPDYDTSKGSAIAREIAQAKAAFESANCTAELVQLSVSANLSSNCEILQNDVDAAEVLAGNAGPNRRKETRTVVITLSVLLFLGLLVYFVGGNADSDSDCGVSTYRMCYGWRHYESYHQEIKFESTFFFCLCSIVIGILGLSFARYGLLKASSITTYSPAHGCLPYNDFEVANASAVFEAEDEAPDASADFEYGYADGWSGTGIYWFMVHLCTPLVAFSVFARPDEYDSSDYWIPRGWIPFSRPEIEDWEKKNVTYLLITIVFAFEMSAIIVVTARAQGHLFLIGYGVFFMTGVSLALCFPAVVHYFYTYEASNSSDFRSERGAVSKVGLFIAATLSLLAVVGIAITTAPEYKIEYISAVTGESGNGFELSGSGLELELQEQLQAANKENERKALTTFAIIGSIVTAGLLTHYGTHPLTRDYELYLLVWGGLLDATTDVLYMMMEVFYDETIFAACASMILLPLVMVALSFWPLMAHEYKNQKWRYIFLPFEGALLLLVLPFISTANIVPAFSASVFSVGYKIAKTIFDKMYVEITEKQTERRGDDGEQRYFKKQLKFYHRGVFEALLAFVLAPVAILSIGAVGLAATAVGTAIMFAFVLAAPMAIALVFSIMAFLRLFVLFPTVWEELYYFAKWFARMARERVPVDDFMDDDRLDKAKGQVFKLYDASSAKDAKADMKDSTIKYLFVEFLLEALPQLIIQGINNNQTDNWSNISIISMSISGIIILNSVIKYGSLYCLVDEVEVFGGFEA